MDKFEKWFNKVNEDLTATPVISTEAEVSVDADRSNMIGDIDTIMTSLETLASELKEELEMDIEIFEAGATDAVMSFINGMKASKAQAKVNKIKMNASDLEFAADKFDGDKKTSIQAKSKKVKLQADALQKMVDDRFDGKGGYVDGKLHKEKIKGQIEIIKRTSGMEDNPKKKADMKTKMQELVGKYKEETKALGELENDEKEALAQAKEKAAGKTTPQESLIYRATEASLLELATEISEKAEWQLDNTVLYTKYDAIIKKAGYDAIITESASIKDRFNTLLNS
jgi:hypothetical protein